MKGNSAFGSTFFALAMLAVIIGFTALASEHVDQDTSPVFVKEIPPGYRDWRLISVAHEEGDLNDIRAILGNDIAVKAYREGTLPFPEGAITRHQTALTFTFTWWPPKTPETTQVCNTQPSSTWDSSRGISATKTTLSAPI
jgi:cytochrome P460